jgi:alpha-N-acetylglucosaminidase
LDRLALWGVSMPLLLNGQEWTFLQTYLSVGLTEAEFNDDYLSGPAFLPWNGMGNIFKLQNPGAGLMLSWVTQQRDLQLQLLQEARFFGTTPVLAGFAGHVSVALLNKFPAANFTQNSGWAGFNASFSGN